MSRRTSWVPRQPRGQEVSSARGGLLARQFQELERLQGRAQYAQQLSQDIERFTLLNATVNMQREVRFHILA